MADAKKLERRGLGRGLSALMADVAADTPDAGAPRPAELSLPIEKIVPNPDQPRRTFSEEALAELSESIRAKGVIQPLIVRKNPRREGTFEIVAGERRWRAAQRAQLHELPVILREFDDLEVLEVAIIENIQRADLNAVEEAAGYRQLMDRFGHTQEKLAQALGKSRSHIANLLRLLTLPDDVIDMLRTGVLTAGHARALVTTEDPSALAREIVRKGLSVREAEALAKRAGKSSPATKTVTAPVKDADTRVLEADLAAALGMRVTIDHDEATGAGRLTVSYKSLDDLDELCARLSANGARD
jgi:ParB family chromosome partitioning protein